MRKHLALLLILTLLIVSIVGCSSLEGTSDYEKGTSGMTLDPSHPTTPNPASDFEYSMNSTQTGILINKYIGSSEHVVIPSHIDDLPVVSLKGVPDKQVSTATAEGVFEGRNVVTVVIPKTIKVIGFRCFKNCIDLKNITIASDSSLVEIHGSSFENCLNLEGIDLSSTQVKDIGSSAFRGCTNLINVVFSSALESIQEKAFCECSSLLEVNFPESLTIIKGGAFASCTSLKKIEVPTKLNLTSLNESIFYDVPSIESIIFKEGRVSITGYALIQTDANVEIIVPASTKDFSPLPFLFNHPAQIVITFLGDAPAIVEDKDVWLEDLTIRYNPENAGWESFIWKDKYEMQPIQ